ncbi:hypothetical protein D9757_010824 [Collybiopsis confluens]|uniref:Uncharacterized protein n=1 Tax=Collybiopsis confluens TaxID=2823264 RepID=A0A8H5GUG2_9AGAR|nr:hypothetical protein D9757_010824 [Collybiopsis confluens]
MRSGTGRMLFEERVLIYLPFQLPSLHWQTSSIREVFPSVTETVLSAGYLVGRTCRWRYALLLALASTTSTVAPVLSLCFQMYMYPNFVSTPVNLSNMTWTMITIFRIVIPSISRL